MCLCLSHSFLQVVPEGTLELAICGMHHLLAVSLLWLGTFQIFCTWFFMVWWLQVSVWLGIFWLFSAVDISGKMKIIRQILKHPADLWEPVRYQHLQCGSCSAKFEPSACFDQSVVVCIHPRESSSECKTGDKQTIELGKNKFLIGSVHSDNNIVRICCWNTRIAPETVGAFFNAKSLVQFKVRKGLTAVANLVLSKFISF